MLLVGTTRHLEDLDRDYTIAEDVEVVAVATAGEGGFPGLSASAVYVLLDRERVARVDEFELVFVAGLPEPSGQSMAAAGETLVVGTGGAHLLSIDLNGGNLSPLEAFDAVPGRDEWENPAGPTPDLRSLAVASDGAWLANVHVGGVWRSTDRGATWTNVIEPDADVHEIVAGSEGRVVVAAAKGFAWSKDGGQTWSWTTDGLHSSYARAVAVDGDTAYVTASTGPSTSDGRLYRCHLGGAPEQLTGGLPQSFAYNLDTGCISASGGEVAFGTHDGHVYRSRNGGDSFELVAEHMRPVTLVRHAG